MELPVILLPVALLRRDRRLTGNRTITSAATMPEGFQVVAIAVSFSSSSSYFDGELRMKELFAGNE
jgi:hypothetical protein